MGSPLQRIDLPLVGQLFKAHMGYVMASVTCLCEEGNSPLLIRGTDQGAGCAKCKRVYVITRVEFDRGRGDTQATVAVVQLGQMDSAAGALPRA